MRLRRDGGRLIFEERSFMLPAVLGAATLLMTYRLWQWSTAEGWSAGHTGLAGGTLAMLALTILIAGGNRFIFDRASGQLTWKRRTLRRCESGVVRLEDITAITVATGVDRKGNRGWRGEVALRNGDTLPLATGHTGSEEQWLDMATAINRFLGLAEAAEETLTDRVMRMLRAGRKPDAVRLLRLETGMDRTAARATIESLAR